MNIKFPRVSLCFVAALFPPGSAVVVKGASIAAQWTFDDAATAGGSVSNVGGFLGTFTGVGGRTAGGGGVSGTAGDYAFDPRLLANTSDGAMTSNTAGFLAALNGAMSTQAMSISYWQFLDSAPASTAFWGTSPSAVGTGANRGLNAHSPWVDGNVYFDTAGCCNGPNRISGPLGATIGEWQLMTMVYNNGTREVWRNTTLVAPGVPGTGGGGMALTGDINFFVVGNDNTLTGLGMDARLDHFTIWTGALTPAEIAVLAVRPTVPEPSSWMLGMLGVWAVCGRRARRA